VVLVDDDGHRIAVADKRGVHHRRTPLHLAFSCYVFDPEGRLLITRRALGKPTWPGVWTNSCCGHPQPDEPIDVAVRRRLIHELGLAAGDEPDLVLPRFRYVATMADGTMENELCPVFVTRVHAGAGLTPRADEVDDVTWVAWREFVHDVLRAGRDISPWCRSQVADLDRLGSDPLAWPTAPAAQLPPAARHAPARVAED